MEKTLTYNGQRYTGFTITEDGEIKNLSTSHIYKHSIHKSGYLVVYLPMGQRGKVRAVRVHKAVAETFIPNPDKLPIVHHIDGNKLNPSLDNLQWVTHKENTKHYHDCLSKKTELFNNRKLVEDEIHRIKELYIQKISSRTIAGMFNVSKTTIMRIVNNQSYQTV